MKALDKRSDSVTGRGAAEGVSDGEERKLLVKGAVSGICLHKIPKCIPRWRTGGAQLGKMTSNGLRRTRRRMS